MKIGVLSLQGAFIEHIHIFEKLGVMAVEVRSPETLATLDGLVIPGGESTSMLNLAHSYGLIEPLREFAASGRPMMGTCAGMILLAKEVADSDMRTLRLMDIGVRRNAFGRQVDSFETDLTIPVIGGDKFHAVFIRSPFIEKVGEGVEILARLEDGTVVAARQESMLALAFHPELGQDTRLHRYFIDMVTEASPMSLRA